MPPFGRVGSVTLVVLNHARTAVIVPVPVVTTASPYTSQFPAPNDSSTTSTTAPLAAATASPTSRALLSSRPTSAAPGLVAAFDPSTPIPPPPVRDSAPVVSA